MFQLCHNVQICCILELQQVSLTKSIRNINRKFWNVKYIWPLRTSIQSGVRQDLSVCLAACVTKTFGLCSDWYELNHRDNFDIWLLWELREICKITQFVVKFGILVL